LHEVEVRRRDDSTVILKRSVERDVIDTHSHPAAQGDASAQVFSGAVSILGRLGVRGQVPPMPAPTPTPASAAACLRNRLRPVPLEPMIASPVIPSCGFWALGICAVRLRGASARMFSLLNFMPLKRYSVQYNRQPVNRRSGGIRRDQSDQRLDM